MNFLQAINSDISVLIVSNKTGGTIKGDIKKKSIKLDLFLLPYYKLLQLTLRNKETHTVQLKSWAYGKNVISPESCLLEWYYYMVLKTDVRSDTPVKN